MIEHLVPAMVEICGPDGVVTDPLDLRTYECDGLTSHRAAPGLVVLPRTAEQVAAVVRVCAGAGVPFVARGSGTGLSGGALPRTDGVLIVTSRMRAHHRHRPGQPAGDRGAGRHQPGGEQPRPAVRLLLRPGPVQPAGLLGGRQRGGELRRGPLPQARLHRAPRHRAGDRHPGGRADLAGRWHRGGARLRPGRRVHRLRGHARHRHQDHREAEPDPADGHLPAGRVRDHRRGRAAVSAIIGGRHRPGRHRDDGRARDRGRRGRRALPLPAGRRGRAHRGARRPEADVRRETAAVRALCEQAGSTEIREAVDPAERAVIWAGRKSAFAAVGRICPAYIVQDGVVPRTALGPVLDEIAKLSAESGHPGRQRVPRRRREPAPARALRRQLAGGGRRRRGAVRRDPGPVHRATAGRITGEHGVGVDKSRYMPKMFGADDLDTMQLLRCAFDPGGLCNPGKVFPTPRLCGEVPGVRRGAAPAGRLRPGRAILMPNAPAAPAAALALARLGGPDGRAAGEHGR